MASRIFEDIMMEHFDVHDDLTRSTLLSINEADQNKVLESLTSKLYQSIMDKVDDIDFGSIPDSKGDITKIQNYEQILECINTIKQILVEYRQDLTPVNTIQLAIENVQNRKDIFSKAFALGTDMPILIYNTIVLSIVSATSLIIATSIDYIKDARTDEFSINFDKVAYVRTKDHLLFTNLVRFNRECASGELDRSIEHVFKMSSKQLMGVDALGVVSIAAVVTMIVSIVPLLRELVYYFYHAKQSVADYFMIQADLIQINSELVKNNSYSGKTQSERNTIAKKQMKWVEAFRKIGNKLDIDSRTANQKATKEAKADNKKYKIDDLKVDKLESLPDNNESIF